MKQIWVGFIVFMAVCFCIADVNYTNPYPFGVATSWAKGSDNSAVGEWWKRVLRIHGSGMKS